MFLDVVKTGENEWTVQTLRGEVLRRYPSQVAAWDHAVWSEHVRRKRVPLVDPGGLYRSNAGTEAKAGWTSDPRLARCVPIASATLEQIDQSRKAAVEFIRANLRGRDPMEVFYPVDLADHDPADYECDLLALVAGAEGEPLTADESAAALKAFSRGPETAPDGPADPSGGEGTADDPRALTERLSDEQRRAWENFTALADDAPSEPARIFWQAKADAVAKGGTDVL